MKWNVAMCDDKDTLWIILLVHLYLYGGQCDNTLDRTSVADIQGFLYQLVYLFSFIWQRFSYQITFLKHHFTTTKFFQNWIQPRTSLCAPSHDNSRWHIKLYLVIWHPWWGMAVRRRHSSHHGTPPHWVYVAEHAGPHPSSTQTDGWSGCYAETCRDIIKMFYQWVLPLDERFGGRKEHLVDGETHFVAYVLYGIFPC